MIVKEVFYDCIKRIEMMCLVLLANFVQDLQWCEDFRDLILDKLLKNALIERVWASLSKWSFVTAWIQAAKYKETERHHF